jgi:hypothetical protein
MIRQQSRETLGEWLLEGEASACPDLSGVTEGIRRDETAILAPIADRWSNGRVDGHVNRSKTIERQTVRKARLAVAECAGRERCIIGQNIEGPSRPGVYRRSSKVLENPFRAAVEISFRG